MLSSGNKQDQWPVHQSRQMSATANRKLRWCQLTNHRLGLIQFQLFILHWHFMVKTEGLCRCNLMLLRLLQLFSQRGITQQLNNSLSTISSWFLFLDADLLPEKTIAIAGNYFYDHLNWMKSFGFVTVKLWTQINVLTVSWQFVSKCSFFIFLSFAGIPWWE